MAVDYKVMEEQFRTFVDVTVESALDQLLLLESLSPIGQRLSKELTPEQLNLVRNHTIQHMISTHVDSYGMFWCCLAEHHGEEMKEVKTWMRTRGPQIFKDKLNRMYARRPVDEGLGQERFIPN